MKTLLSRWIERYEAFKYPAFDHKLVTFSGLSEQLTFFEDKAAVKKEVAGYSLEGRPIHKLTWGIGSKKILVWTQMHGNESTATRAVFDLFSCLLGENDLGFDKDTLYNQIQLIVIPMLNPDGSERFIRRNALGIDPNRDAAKQSTPEIQLLFKVLREVQPHWCFNMHDQRNLFNVKGSAQPATISFLSPSVDASDRLETNQKEAMQLIDLLNDGLQQYIPNAIGRFTHEFYPTASGDNIQQLGFRTILVESGGALNDPERAVARKMNFILLLESLFRIADDSWKEGSVERYLAIPENDQKLYDLVVRNVQFVVNGHTVKTDIAIRQEEYLDTTENSIRSIGKIADLGDLTYYHGYQEINGEGGTVFPSVRLGDIADFSIKMTNESTIKINNGLLSHE